MIAQITQKLNEGGAFFTYPMVLVLIILIVYFVKALRKKEMMPGYAKLIAAYGWFVFAWGSMGSAWGMIVAFDTLKKILLVNLTAQQLAGGLRMVLICSLLGSFVFSISRLFVLILQTVEVKKNSK